MILLEPSLEQKNIINIIKNCNISVDAVAGSGKTTTNLYVAKTYIDKKILLLTYNKDLKFDSRKKASLLNLNNIEIHSYHSFCVKYYYKKAFDDNGIIRILENNYLKLEKFNFSIIIIDEIQDLNSLYYQLICKIFSDNTSDPNILLLGDKNQCINTWNNSDWRYLKYSNELFDFNSLNWKYCNLSTSFRLTYPISNFINFCMLNENRIHTIKNGSKPKYIICDTFNFIDRRYSKSYEEVNKYLKLGYLYEDFFILAPSVRGGKKFDPPIRQLANILSINNIPIYVPNSDDVELDKNELEGKIVFSTFHQAKGRERKVVIVFNFDESYFTYYAKNRNIYICPNELYVACSRSLEKLILIHHYQNDYLSFLNREILGEYCDFDIDIPIIKSNNNTSKNFNTSVTELTKHLPSLIMEHCLGYFEKVKIQNKDRFINIPSKIKQNNLVEGVSEITGIAIPTYFEYIITNKMSILNQMNMYYRIKNDDYQFIDDSDEESEKSNEYFNIENINTNKLLYISNRWNSYKTGYIFKLNQIKDYNWLTDENLEKCISRLKDKISKKARYEVKYELEGYHELYNRNLTGFIDCIDDNDTNINIWEIKCVKSLKNEHILQLAIYMYMNKKTLKNNTNYNITKNFKYFLFNVLSNEIYSIDGTLDNLEEMIKYLIEHKYFNKNIISDIQFIENGLKLREKFNLIKQKFSKKKFRVKKKLVTPNV